jgi:hypothetical protein
LKNDHRGDNLWIIIYTFGLLLKVSAHLLVASFYTNGHKLDWSHIFAVSMCLTEYGLKGSRGIFLKTS